MATIDDLLQQLPPEFQREVEDFAQFLLEKSTREGERKKRVVGQGWAGALRDFCDEYTSLELQKKALEWRGDSAVFLADRRTPAQVMAG